MKPTGKDDKKLRLNVFLSHNGIASRRKAFDLVKAGRVAVNGKPVREPSFAVNPSSDFIMLDGKAVGKKSYNYVMLNKVKGCVTTKKRHMAQRSVMEFLPRKYQHLSPVGRLDKDTEGLLLFTNDGDTAQSLAHPKYNIEKAYEVRLDKPLVPRDKKAMEHGIVLDGRKTAAAKISGWRSGQSVFLLTIHEGRKRQIRLMCAKLGYAVVSLKRLSQGPLSLGDLPPGKCRELTRREIRQLKKLSL